MKVFFPKKEIDRIITEVHVYVFDFLQPILTVFPARSYR